MSIICKHIGHGSARARSLTIESCASRAVDENLDSVSDAMSRWRRVRSRAGPLAARRINADIVIMTSDPGSNSRIAACVETGIPELVDRRIITVVAARQPGMVQEDNDAA